MVLVEVSQSIIHVDRTLKKDIPRGIYYIVPMKIKLTDNKIYILIRLNHVIRGKSRDACNAISESVLYLASRLPMLMLPCSQPAALAAATLAGRAGGCQGRWSVGRRSAKMLAVFREDLFTCASAKMLFAGFASY